MLKQNTNATVFAFYTNCRFLKRLSAHMAAPHPSQDQSATDEEYTEFVAQVEIFDTFIMAIVKGALANLGVDCPPPMVERIRKEPPQNKITNDFWF